MHFIALLKMDMANRHFIVMDARAINEMSAIDYIDSHRWIAFIYFGAILLIGAWFTIRMAPKWIFRTASLAFSLPCMIYLRICVDIDWKLVDWGAQ